MDLKTAERIARGENLIAEAERLIAKHRADKKAARARRRSRSPRASGPDKADRKAAKREETAELRAYAYEKWGGRCLVCMGVLGDPWHLHHIESGGMRLSRQSKENTVPLCEACHRAVHRNDVSALAALLNWAMSNAYHATWVVLNRRIAKIHEARRTP